MRYSTDVPKNVCFCLPYGDKCTECCEFVPLHMMKYDIDKLDNIWKISCEHYMRKECEYREDRI